eukprot:CAMPEP_0177772654 /NCGR_PEP_ID=MMETSP0491_2-20121128/12376_1 /TAXON_ID=63592 /ORGANISM="Tetraselmis chuii, Strain PLY429" /LENGTH=158 /DNA_ID=CAMNT_0019290555 /DNA_START=67 /DNA_END=543 /DNA_ORIENTATION=+
MSTKAPPAHPKYEVMIAEAIKSLKDRTGSSSPAIAKYLETTYGSSLPPNWKKVLAVQLKRLADNGKLVKVKASFKLGEALKKPAPKPKPAKKPVAKKVVTKKVVKKTTTKKPAAKKTPVKKATTAKPKKAITKKTPVKKAPAKKPAAAKPAAKKAAKK